MRSRDLVMTSSSLFVGALVRPTLDFVVPNSRATLSDQSTIVFAVEPG